MRAAMSWAGFTRCCPCSSWCCGGDTPLSGALQRARTPFPSRLRHDPPVQKVYATFISKVSTLRREVLLLLSCRLCVKLRACARLVHTRLSTMRRCIVVALL